LTLPSPVKKALSNLVVIIGSVGSVVGILAFVGPTVTNAVIALLLSSVFVTTNIAFNLSKEGQSSRGGAERLSAYYEIGYGDGTNWLPWMVDARDSRYASYNEYLDRFCRATPNLDPEDREAHLRLVAGLRNLGQVVDKDTFGGEYHEFRKRARAKYDGLAKGSR
jgi:hypothetical protein